MAKFPIRRVDRTSADAVEMLGSKPKFWFRDGASRLLFKADDRGTGEDWAEVIACHLCELLGLPHVDYELAEEIVPGGASRPGVVCENMAPPPLSLVLGNQLLLGTDPAYPTAQQWHVRQHSVDAVAESLVRLLLPSQAWTSGLPGGIQSAMDVFIGYVMLDGWIANQDRHHENWGALKHDDVLCLAPTFDHGAALARNITDEERTERLTTKDKNRTIAAFAERARSAFYANPADKRALGTLDAWTRFARYAPLVSKIWLAKLASIADSDIWSILDRVPDERMSDICKQFTFELLAVNRQRMLHLSEP